MSEVTEGILRMPDSLFWSDDPVARFQHNQARHRAADEIGRLQAALAAAREEVAAKDARIAELEAENSNIRDYCSTHAARANAAADRTAELEAVVGRFPWIVEAKWIDPDEGQDTDWFAIARANTGIQAELLIGSLRVDRRCRFRRRREAAAQAAQRGARPPCVA